MTLSDNIGAWFYDEQDPIAKEYADNYWAERDALNTIASTWDAEMLDAVSVAIDAVVAGRASDRAEVRAMLMGQGPA